MQRFAILFLTACAGPALAGGHGQFYECRAQGLSITVEIAADDCQIDGRSADKVSDNPVVCHLSDPQLRIFTLQDDLSFRYEDTDSDRVFDGTCAAS